MQFHQVLVSARRGEAQMNAALEIRSLLRQIGPSEIYARYIDRSVGKEVLPLAKLGRRWSAAPRNDLLLYHCSIGDPEVHAFVTDRPERMVMMYHNISPAGAYLQLDPAKAGLLENGRRELGELRDRVEMALAVSEYNAAELRALGYRNVRVAPLVIDVAALWDIEPHAPTMHHFAEAVDGPVVLFVGQLLPHKRPDFLLQAYHLLNTFHRPDAHLVLVGHANIPRYRRALEQLVRELHFHRCWMTGSVTLDRLAAFFRNGTVFATASEHEGFCVPLIEAMGFGLPVVARGCAAVPDTVAGAGIVLPAEEGPALFAEALAAVLDDASLRTELRERGYGRVKDFDADKARATLLGHLLDVV